MVLFVLIMSGIVSHPTCDLICWIRCLIMTYLILPININFRMEFCDICCLMPVIRQIGGELLVKPINHICEELKQYANDNINFWMKNK